MTENAEVCDDCHVRLQCALKLFCKPQADQDQNQHRWQAFTALPGYVLIL